MNSIQRDTLLVVAPSAAGKTKILNVLRQWLETAGVPMVFQPHSDSHTIKQRMFEDDAEGGKHHYHPWCRGKIDGHSHNEGKPIIPFTLAGNKIVEGYMLDFFSGLALMPDTGVLRFAEWSGGTNLNDESDPASRTDLSFTTIGRMLHSGQLPPEGLRRVLAVIHPQTDDSLRLKLNEARHVPSEEEMTLGTASWQLDEAGMKIFGRDDFDALVPLFVKFGIPHVHTIHNDGKNSLVEGLEQIVPGILLTWKESWRGGEGVPILPRKEL